MKRVLFCLVPVALLLSAPAFGDDGPEKRGPRDPEKMKQILDKFDEDGDGKLSTEERQAARKAMAERRGQGPGARDRGPRDRGPEARKRGPGGPEGDRGPRRGPEGDRGPRRGPEGDRGPRGDGPPPRGPEGRGPGGPPSPEAMFDRLDEDGDGQLSKEEFIKFARRMQQMRGPGRPPGPPPGAFGRGRGPGAERPDRGRGPGQGGPEQRGPRRGPPEE